MHTVTAGTTATARAVPSLLTLVRLATSAEVEDPSWTRGAARRSPGTCETPPLWRTPALIGCLLLRAGATGPGPALPTRFLDREFGRHGVTRFEELDYPATLTHEPTRRFLRETGLPADARPFRLDADELALPTLTEYAPAHPLPARADHLIRLGALFDDIHVLADGTTGEILTWTAPGTTLHPLTADVSALALTLWALRRTTLLEAAAGIEPA
ncbi:SUKH-4 family immunity protein [Streptomyces ziwulingensis]|uniref:SUKH-4 family immunity protein n=1 Tax=Streptomyces ziwulingensis TaxID=1045501 RepID=A0ABP9CW37_9ACTN